ncbi:DNA alkylation repair protein [Amaricoccus solimangrovi]|uniref:DNA alkylation repair protein n=1 Tax=Amaricoccus solimangrovi TaxID=2589815 RepID=A0A501WNH9_9RHOB|nr:DNA alkylation repair protein [Amaricoccus solimangrovi]TPE48551.1 DNA alkylation repair protein [Amaricoccus solimangrovi]
MTTPDEALARLARDADPAAAPAMAAYHKAPRRYLGLALPGIDACVADWRAALDVPARVALAAGLWDSDVHEARIAAAKLLTQARLGTDDPLVWAEFLRWVPDFDAWAIADQACKAGERRLVAEPRRLDTVEAWIEDPNPWARRAALVATLPWTKLTHPSPGDLAARERVLGWAGRLVADRNWFTQKAIGAWLRSLSLRDPARVAAFLDGPGRDLKSFARKEAARRIA